MAVRTRTLLLATITITSLLGPLAGSATAFPTGSPEWIDVRNLPSGLEGSMGGWIGGSFYVAGGHNASHADIATLQRYDLGSDTWSPLNATMAFARAEGFASVVGDKLYVYGGRDGNGGSSCPSGPGNVCNTTEAFDPATGNWARLADMSFARAGLGGAGVPPMGPIFPAGLVLATGGRDGNTPSHGNATNLTELFNISAGAWMPGPSLPDARSELSATLWHPTTNSVYVLGGYNTTTQQPLASVLRLNLSAGPGASWANITGTLTGSMTPRYSATAGFCGNDIIVAGGITGGFDSRTRTTLVEMLNLTTGVWSTPTALPYNFSEAAAGHTGNGAQVMLAGSGIHGAVLNRTILYDCTGDLNPANFAEDALANESGGGGGGGLPACTGANTADGSVTIVGSTNDTVRIRANTTGCATVVTAAGDRSFTFPSLPGGTITFQAWVDQNDNGARDGQEPSSAAEDHTIPGSGIGLTINLGGGGPQPCSGSESASGTVTIQGGSPAGPLRVRARNDACQTTVSTDGSGAFTIPNLPGSLLSFEAFVDTNSNNALDPTEPVSAPANATPPASGLTLTLNLGGGGGGGGEFTGDGSGLTIEGVTFYNGTRTVQRVEVGFMPFNTTNGTGQHRSKAAVGAYNFSGFPTDSFFDVFTWLETDGIGGPSVHEPFGFLQLPHPNVDVETEILALELAPVTGLNIEFLDPPAEGWDPAMLPQQGGPGAGGPGGGGGCSVENGGTFIGHVGDRDGVPLPDAFARLENLTSRTGEFPPIDANGTFACTVNAGSYRIEANHPDLGFFFVDSTIASDETKHVWLNLSFDFRPPYQRPTDFYGGTVWGNVTYENGTGVSGVRVNAFPSAPPGSGGPAPCEPANPQTRSLTTCGSEGQTNASGSFVMTALGAGTWDMFIDGAPAGLPGRFVNAAFTIGNVTNASETKQDLGRFNFSAPGYIRGWVNRSADASPVNGAEVNAWTPCQPGEPCSGGGFGQTDAQGFFELAVTPGNYGLAVRAPSGSLLTGGQRECGDHPGANCVNVTAGSAAYVWFNLTQGSLISGRVNDSNGDPARAFINVENCGFGPGPCNFYWGETDFTGGPGGGSTGYYNITVPSGTYRVKIEPDRFQHPDLATNTTEAVVVSQGGTTYHNVTLGAGASLFGRVFAPDGVTPAPFVNLFANVHVDQQGPGCCFGGPGGFGFTDRDGNFNIAGLSAGSFDVFVEPGSGSAYMRTQVSNVAVSSGPNGPLHITLNAGGTLAGFVLAGDGSPIADAFVDAFWQPDFAPGGGPGPGGDPGFHEPPAQGGWGHARTDGSGFYEIRGLTNGTFGMYVSPPFGTSYTNAHLNPFEHVLPEVAIGQTTFHNFTLSAGGQIAGCVKNPDGSSTNTAFGWVSAHSPTGFGGGEPTGSDGCFTIRGVAAGTYELEVQPPFNNENGRARLSNVVVTEGQTTNVGDVLLGAGVRFAGTVTSGGQPVANAFVNVFQHHEPGQSGPGAWGFAITNAQGEFNISGLTAGRYGVEVKPPFDGDLSAKFIPEIQIDETGRYNYAITLGGGGWITGQVTDGASAPLANAWIGAWSFNGGSGGGTITNATGHYNISGLAAATDYNLDVFPPFDRQNLAGYHEFPLSISEGAGTTKNVQLIAGGTLIGRVVNTTGAGVPFAFINVDGAGSFAWGMTDATGNFSVNGVRGNAGQNLTVSVEPSFGSSATSTRVTHAWAPNASSISDAGTITLDAGRVLSGRIMVDGTTGFANVDVFVMPTLPYFGPPIGGSATTNAGGWYNITGLPSGQSWDVRLEPRDGTAGYFEAGVVTTTDATNWYNFTFGGTVTTGNLNVTVTSGGNPVEAAQVDCFSASTRDGTGSATDSLGNANLTGLRAGVYKCRVFAANNAPAGQDVNVTDGGTTAVSFALTSVATFNVTGTLSTTNASGAGGYLILIVPSGTLGDDAFVGSNVTATNGAYTIRGVPTATYELKVLNGAGRVVTTTTVVVAADTTQNVDATSG